MSKRGKILNRIRKANRVGREYIITVERDMRRESAPRARCTCGWKTEQSTDLLILGRAAFQHSNETGHKLREHD